MKLSEIDRTSFVDQWSLPDLGITDLSPLANAFYDYYEDDELIATTSLKFFRRWELYVRPIIMNIGYEMKRWKAIKDQTPTSSRNRNITTKDVYDTSTTYRATHNSNGVTSTNQGYQGYPIFSPETNAENAFKKDSEIFNTSNVDTSNSNYTSTNNITNTDATSIVNLWEVKEWLDTHYTTTLQDYFNEIANIIFIKFW